jgi:hypothetical protein
MVEEKRLSDTLQHVDQIIAPPDMSKFVRKQRFHVFRR